MDLDGMMGTRETDMKNGISTTRMEMKSTIKILKAMKNGENTIKRESYSTVRPLTETNYGTNILIDRTEQ